MIQPSFGRETGQEQTPRSALDIKQFHHSGSSEAIVRFGQCWLWPRRRQLLVNERPVDLGSRAFDLLTLLIEARGAVLTKREIMSRLWPDTIVDESNLRVQIAALRKALSDDREMIKTIAGRGYVFTAEITRVWSEPGALRSLEQGASPVSARPAQSRAGGYQVNFPEDEEYQPAVVVIDDDPDIREALEGLLRSVGLRVELFASVQEFVGSSRPDLPGCLVLYVRLPGRSGLDFQDDLADAGIDLPVIFISGHADVPMSVRAMKAGAVEFLTKPVRHQELLDSIQLAIARDRARRSRWAVDLSHAPSPHAN
jgi:DNA-binding response OmpR family regulator